MGQPVVGEVPALAADRPVRIVVYLAPGHVRQTLIEKRGQHPDETRLCLASKAKKYEVVTGENGIRYLRAYAFVEAYDAREECLTTLQFADEVGSQLVLNGSRADSLLGVFVTGAQFPKSGGQVP